MKKNKLNFVVIFSFSTRFLLIVCFFLSFINLFSFYLSVFFYVFVFSRLSCSPIKLRTNLRFLKSKKPTSLSNGPSPKKYPLNGYSTAPSTYTSPSKVAVNHSSPNKPSPTNKSKQVTKLRRDQKVQSYNVTIITGNDQSHATDANVFITLHGTKGDTQRQQLREDSDNFDVSKSF